MWREMENKLNFGKIIFSGIIFATGLSFLLFLILMLGGTEKLEMTFYLQIFGFIFLVWVVIMWIILKIKNRGLMNKKESKTEPKIDLVETEINKFSREGIWFVSLGIFFAIFSGLSKTSIMIILFGIFIYFYRKKEARLISSIIKAVISGTILFTLLFQGLSIPSRPSGDYLFFLLYIGFGILFLASAIYDIVKYFKVKSLLAKRDI